MKKILFAITTAVFLSFSFIGNAAGNKNKDYKIPDARFVDYFGSIRADFYREACSILKVDNEKVINAINSESLIPFKKETDALDKNVSYKKDLLEIYKCYSGHGIEGKDCNKDFNNLKLTIEGVCNYLKNNKYIDDAQFKAMKESYLNKAALTMVAYKALIEYKVYKDNNKFYSYEKYITGEHNFNYDNINEEDFELLKGFISGFLKKDIGGAETITQKINVTGAIIDNQKNESAERLNEIKNDKANREEVVTDKNSNQNEDKKDTDNQSDNTFITVFVILILAFSIFVFIKKRARDKNKPNVDTKPEEKKSEPTVEKKPAPTPVNQPAEQPSHEGEIAFDDGNISVIGASVIGNGHVTANMPCQDCCAYKNLGHGWGIAVTSDGAGSAKYSETGSKIVANRAIEHFSKQIITKGWLINKHVPTAAEWSATAYEVLKTICKDLSIFAQTKSLELKTLNATIITVIHTPFGLLVCHVGDGRAGYKTSAGEWLPLIKPHKGEEANQTIFLTSDIWNTPNFVMSGVPVPECRVIIDKVKAFTLMSDGCESASWQYNQLNEETGKFYDPNMPYSKFFDPLLGEMKYMHDINTDTKNRLDKWIEFLKEGDNFKKETDDKTMIIGQYLI